MTSYERCFYKPVDRSVKKFKIYCFAHVGGSSSIVNNLFKYTPEDVEIIGILLSGRENRFVEPLNDDLASVVEEVAMSISEENQKEQTPYLLIGQCSGAILGYETALKLREDKNLKGLILCSRPSPNYRVDEIQLEVPDAEFVEQVKEIGGINKEILDEPLMMELLLPILKNDFKMIGGYTRSPENKVHVPLLVLKGQEDTGIRDKEVVDWREYTNSECTIMDVPGGHFLFEDAPKAVMEQSILFANKI